MDILMDSSFSVFLPEWTIDGHIISDIFMMPWSRENKWIRLETKFCRILESLNFKRWRKYFPNH